MKITMSIESIVPKQGLLTFNIWYHGLSFKLPGFQTLWSGLKTVIWLWFYMQITWAFFYGKSHWPTLFFWLHIPLYFWMTICCFVSNVNSLVKCALLWYRMRVYKVFKHMVLRFMKMYYKCNWDHRFRSPSRALVRG